MENIRINLKNEKHSEAVQKRLFELGYSWNDGQVVSCTEYDYLATYQGKIGHSHCKFLDSNSSRNSNDTRRIVTLDDLYDMPIYSNKKLLKAFIEATKELKELNKRMEKLAQSKH